MASVLDLIKHYQHAIEKYPNDEQKILKCINKLFQLDVTVQHLQETGVGRTVNALRKEPGDVGQAARALVYKWKVMVAAEESDQEADHRNDTSNYNGNISERDSEDSTPQSKSRHDQYEKSSKSSKSTGDYKHMNGDSSSHKRRHHSSEEEEPETKKSKHSSTNDDKYKRKYVKSESSESDTQDTDNSQSNSSESDTSQSSEEDRKPKHKIKEEKQEEEKSNSSKHISHSSHKDRKNDSASEKQRDSSDKHSKHRSESTKSEKSSLEKVTSSHKQTSTKDKESSSNKKEKSSHKSVEKEKKNESSSKHSSSKKESSNKKDKHNSAEKHASASEKQNSSNEKTKEKSSSKELSRDNHKSRESSSSKHSSSSKDRLSKDRSSKDRSSKDRSSKDRSSKDRSSKDSSSKEKSSKDRSREKHSSSKESDHSQKTDKKHSSDSSSKERKEKHKKESDKSGDDKKKHSHSSSKSSKSSSSKSTEDIPKKKAHISNSEDSGDDGIDCGSGASFAEALGMISPTKPKKKTNTVKEFLSPNPFPDLSPASLLAPTAKLMPLPPLEISALPEISPNYKPRPPPKLLPHFTDEDAMSHVISSKNQRTKVYSGNKVIGKIPTLYEMCVHVLQEHIDALEYTGGVPYEILKPVVDMASPQQLFMLEHFNPYLMEDTDHLWQKFCEKHFRNKQRQEMETWREMYMRCQEEQEHRLKSLTANIKQTQEAKKAPIKQTKMAYVDTVVKPPRNILRKQAQHGTAHASTASPAARVASLASAPNVLRGGSVRRPPATPVSSSNFNKPKKAPLMQKALQFMRGRKR
ncbi:Transcription elongation factor B polypeptide 3 [Papilio machaon]|uniref:Transcription elongation factor B polypeptide 3 n=1 Tax=Papilio machaon TaxID=76193 RepID=A0A194RPI2_PAPMA|nr:Transcription elongation factor B polypeptide 3 [Papilio machaon]